MTSSARSTSTPRVAFLMDSRCRPAKVATLYVRAHLHVLLRACMHVCIRMCACMHVCPRKGAQVEGWHLAWMHVCARACVRACVRACIACVYVRECEGFGNGALLVLISNPGRLLNYNASKRRARDSEQLRSIWGGRAGSVAAQNTDHRGKP